MKEYTIWLVKTFGEGEPIVNKLLKKYGSAENAFNELTKSKEPISDELNRYAISAEQLDAAKRTEENCAENNISVITRDDEDYPPMLLNTYFPPELLFAKGNIHCLKNKCLTVAGARNSDKYILELCKRICTDVAENGITIVSGTVSKLDQCALFSCAAAGRPAAAVLAYGIESERSKTSELQETIISAGGVCVSEMLPDSRATPKSFHACDRILAGISHGTAVFQAGYKSGSLITAAYAAEENRDIFCVPPPDIYDEKYSGVIGLLRDGAVPIFNHEDIIARLNDH